ncbi:aminoacyl-tRNA deacylase [Brevibacillus fulvus]|uniref:Prolyl-tRNA editing enzyme YbaK/EbsC (Cys-tRNA(Pro) deacylase) n=1 Tax=Brevibacillus fulvus TaxID=1125967 RepID=A0A938XRR7_9BACL|nr:YbaK/EbsC family protein [Brevibacillus fulvus]MBM7589073.1 prolyl-tRNA editing enzyme YbaK/EbsC (Cys-tRNA(Pro) deacylase) [Brevibacillus fulvus]
MDLYHQKVIDFIADSGLQAEHIILAHSCHSVTEAATAVNEPIQHFVKNICMVADDERLIVAIVKGEDRASTSRVAKALQSSPPRLATETEILEKTGFPAGGVPSFGFPATFLIDPKVMEVPYLYTGGGSPFSLTRLSPQELLAHNRGSVVRVRK